MNFGYMPVSKDERLWATFCHYRFSRCLLPVIGISWVPDLLAD